MFRYVKTYHKALFLFIQPTLITKIKYCLYIYKHFKLISYAFLFVRVLCIVYSKPHLLFVMCNISRNSQSPRFIAVITHCQYPADSLMLLFIKNTSIHRLHYIRRITHHLVEHGQLYHMGFITIYDPIIRSMSIYRDLKKMILIRTYVFNNLLTSLFIYIYIYIYAGGCNYCSSYATARQHLKQNMTTTCQAATLSGNSHCMLCQLLHNDVNRWMYICVALPSPWVIDAMSMTSNHQSLQSITPTTKFQVFINKLRFHLLFCFVHF